MKKQILLTFIFFASIAQAQVSGYMGKKFSVIYTTSISFPHLSELYDGKLRPNFSLNQKFALEYVISKGSAVGISYKYAYNKVRNDFAYNREPNFVKFNKFQSHSAGVYYKVFTSRNIAPLGFYIKPGLNFQYLMLNDYASDNRNIFRLYNFKQIDIVASFAVGKNWILFDNIFLGFEIRSGMPFASFIRTVFGDDYTIIEEYKGNRHTNKVNLPTELLQIGLNLGFLAF